jgi:hypothetical protein
MEMENMISFKEKAIEEYEKKIEEDIDYEKKAANNLASTTLKILQERIGKDNFSIIDILEKNPYYTIFVVDGIKIKANYQQNFYLLEKCNRCGLEEIPITGNYYQFLINVGKILKDGHDRHDCNKIIESKISKIPKKKKIESSEEKLINALKEIISENSPY